LFADLLMPFYSPKVGTSLANLLIFDVVFCFSLRRFYLALALFFKAKSLNLFWCARASIYSFRAMVGLVLVLYWYRVCLGIVSR